MSIAIADCGGNKIDWRWWDADRNIKQHQSRGFNFKTVSEEKLQNIIHQDFKFLHEHEIQTVYFYGAGLSSLADKNYLTSKINEQYPSIAFQVEDDLLAACRATCLETDGITCILGTGSNAAVYKGNKIVKRMQALGFLLGDEGSGAYFGKTLLKSYLENELPQDLKQKFEADFVSEVKNDVLHKLYKAQEPAQYLSGFAPFWSENMHHPYLLERFIEGIELFMSKSIHKFDEHASLPIHFVGSFSYFNQSTIEKIVRRKGLMVGKFLQSPIAGLSLYHKLTEL